MSVPRLIATDLDGTLLGPDGKVSPRTKQAIDRAAAAGIPVVAATGRSRHSAVPKLADVDGIRWIVCSNGAMVWDRHHDTIDTHRPIGGDVARTVLATLRSAVPDVAIGWETPRGFGFDRRFAQRPPTIDEYRLRTDLPEPDATVEVTKLVVSVVGLDGAENMHTTFTPHMPATVTAAASGNSFMEVTAAGVTKATTLALLTARLGFAAHEVAAFGDQHNDLDMLRWAGSGLAMANAEPRVADAADAQVPSNAEDGVATVIERWLRAT